MSSPKNSWDLFLSKQMENHQNHNFRKKQPSYKILSDDALNDFPFEMQPGWDMPPEWGPPPATPMLPHADEDLICRRIYSVFGELPRVFHEDQSEVVHVDIYAVPPSPKYPYNILITGGLSARPMFYGKKKFYSELMLFLPSRWPMSMEDFKNECHFWPIWVLKKLCRYPHEDNTWLGAGHSMDLADPQFGTVMRGTHFWGVIFTQSVLPEFRTLTLQGRTPISMLQVIPVYKEEMDMKNSVGIDALLTRFTQFGVNPNVVNPERPNVAK